ncbi:MAG TPA: hypothetical protein VHI99_20975 [Vicinamibacterales bacterium]|jgi:hypothetical protein|nr:hypothetical protein [Vicinamibacterales bacterium]
MLIASFVAIAALAGMAPSPTGSVIEVSNVEQLYDAVNEPANAGATIVLAPGRYVLTRVKPGVGTRPNNGRLELQTDMSISGVTGHPGDVVIDSSDPVNGPSFALEGGLGNGGTIRIGRGRNSVEWLTVVGGSNSAAGVQTDLVGAPAVLRVAHVVSRGSVRGIDVRNLGPAGAGRTIVIDLDDNEVFENTAMNGQGLRFVNSNADGASIVATLHNNRSHDNNQGFLASNERSNHASITIDSHDDRFEDDMIGGVIFGGLTTAAGTASGNTVTFTMHAGSIDGSHGSVPTQNLTAGLNVIGGAFTPPLGTANSAASNAVRVSIWGTKFDDNAALDVEAWGAKSLTPDLAGTENVVTVDLHGVSAQARSLAHDSVPDEAAGTNRATIDATMK